MSETSSNEEIAALDRHVPAPPADGTTATTEPAEDAAAATTAESTPIKPLDRHVP